MDITKCCATMFQHVLRAYAWLVSTCVAGLWVGISTAKNLNNSTTFLEDLYCQRNSMVKDEPDIVHENYTNPCNSEIVLHFTVDDLRSPLLVPLGMQAIVTLALIPTSVLTIYGARRTKARLMFPWLIANGLCVICLIMRMGILGHFGFKNYVWFLLPFAVFAVFFLLDVGWFTLKILRTTGTYEVKPLPMQDFDDGRTPALEFSSAV